jgi:hypothetical protein
MIMKNTVLAISCFAIAAFAVGCKPSEDNSTSQQPAPQELSPTPAATPTPAPQEPPPAPAAPPPNASADPVPEINLPYFQGQLSPYGAWVDLPPYGPVWHPGEAINDPNWRPYC